MTSSTSSPTVRRGSETHRTPHAGGCVGPGRTVTLNGEPATGIDSKRAASAFVKASAAVFARVATITCAVYVPATSVVYVKA